MTLTDLAEAGHIAAEDDVIVLTPQEAREIVDAIEEKDLIADGLRMANHHLRSENARHRRLALLERRGADRQVSR